MSKAQVERLVRLIREGGVDGADELYRVLLRTIPELNLTLKNSTKVLRAVKEKDHVSKHLVEMLTSLRSVVNYFTNSSRLARVRFLSQLHFWVIKRDALVSEVNSFEERSLAWRRWDRLEESLRVNGFRVRGRVIEDTKSNLRDGSRWYRTAPQTMVAPVKTLRALSEEWDTLIELTSTLLKVEDQEDFIELYRS